MTFHIITIFPKAFESYFKTSIIKRAIDNKLIKINIIDLRKFANDKYKIFHQIKYRQSFSRVDDRPYGGGPGMVLKVEPIYRCIQFLKSKIKNQKSKIKIILFSTRGKKLESRIVKNLSKYTDIILICGHYEGVDERVAKYIADEEISVGDYILTGGEIPAMIIVDAVSRFIPGVLGKRESLEQIKGSYPVYTRPEIFVTKNKKKWVVPKILLSGNHKKIEEWRKRNIK